jgi:transcriptional regulator with XRE-family HTH domain
MEIREFLTSRRARITPDQAGLRVYGDNRGVPGLRREEVALHAGVSVDYYTRLERGNMSGASESVLNAIANALQLDDAERAHLFDLARAMQATGRRRRRTTKQQVRPSVQRILDAMTGAPAYIRNGRADILAANALGYALYSPIFASPVRPATRPASSSSTRLRPASSPSGTPSRARWPRPCELKPAAIRMTAASRIS